MIGRGFNLAIAKGAAFDRLFPAMHGPSAGNRWFIRSQTKRTISTSSAFTDFLRLSHVASSRVRLAPAQAQCAMGDAGDARIRRARVGKVGHRRPRRDGMSRLRLPHGLGWEVPRSMTRPAPPARRIARFAPPTGAHGTHEHQAPTEGSAAALDHEGSGSVPGCRSSGDPYKKKKLLRCYGRRGKTPLRSSTATAKNGGFLRLRAIP